MAAISTWAMEDLLLAELGEEELARRVHRVCRYLRPGQPCKGCPRVETDEDYGECHRMCFSLAFEAIAYGHGAVHPRDAALDPASAPSTAERTS